MEDTEGNREVYLRRKVGNEEYVAKDGHSGMNACTRSLSSLALWALTCAGDELQTFEGAADRTREMLVLQ